MKHFLELLLAGCFFLILQLVVSRTVLTRWLRLGKSAYLRLNRTKHSSGRPDETLEIRRGAEPDVVDLVHDLYDNDESVRTFYENFYHNGIEPWIAKRDNKVVGVVWLYTGYYISPWQGYDGFVLRLEIEPTARFVANVFVGPESRGQGIFSKIVQRFLDELPNDVFYSAIAEENIPSIRAHEKIGFRRCGATYYVQLFGWTWAVFVPKWGISRVFRILRGTTVSVVLSRSEVK